MRPNGAVPRRVTTVMYYDVIPHPTSGNILTQYRRPRVQHGTLGQHFRAFPLPKGAGQNEVWMKETLRQRKPHLSSPKSAARLPWATLSYIFVARGCSTARLGDTSARFRRPKVLGKRRKVESDKKRRSLPKTRETSVGCPKPGSNRHVFKGHWILSPTRLPIPPFLQKRKPRV